MAEYPLWSPNKRGKLYKRFTDNIDVNIQDRDDVIAVQKNYYVCRDTFRWVDINNAEKVEEQPLTGLAVPNEYRTIRTNSRAKFDVGDIVELPGLGLYIIQDGIQIGYAYTPKRVQTYQNLSLSSVGI